MFRRSRVVKIPAGVSDEQAAVLMLKGITACYLLRHTLSRASAATSSWCTRPRAAWAHCSSQWGRALGAMVIGIVGSEDKAAAREEERLQARAGARAR